MEKKTKVQAENGQQFLIITREFDLPVDLLFKAYTEPELVAQWMDNTVLKLENRNHGGYQFQKKDPSGNVVFSANGVIHETIPNQKIVRTFEMENAPMGVQLEFMDFEALTATTSQLSIRIVYKSAEQRDLQLKMPFAYGINIAHDRLQEIANKLKS